MPNNTFFNVPYIIFSRETYGSNDNTPGASYFVNGQVLSSNSFRLERTLSRRVFYITGLSGQLALKSGDTVMVRLDRAVDGDIELWFGSGQQIDNGLSTFLLVMVAVGGVIFVGGMIVCVAGFSKFSQNENAVTVE